jgi:ABC transport system ATP-binding/permease protein
MFEYWLVLFSCWAGANMLGLLISDSFKAVVTIYILIPFLVIPQIILSGIIVKFEKLNPNISSPVSIPVYGEFIVARWGYEALAVNQFIYNDYEKLFYKYDKAKSKGNFKKNYWYVEIKGKLDNISNDLQKSTKGEDFNDNLLLVSNEIKKQMKELPEIGFDYASELTPDKVTPEAVNAALKYVDTVRKYYIVYYNNANNQKDAIINNMQSENNKAFLKLQATSYNKSLEEFVTDKNETNKTLIYKGELIQKLEPIFMDPKYKFVKAHFYSPQKQIFGLSVDTYVVNVIVLWFMTLLLYLALYFRVLKRLLDSGEAVIGKKR